MRHPQFLDAPRGGYVRHGGVGAGRGRRGRADAPTLGRHTNKGACDDAPTALFPVGLFPNCFTINRAAHPDKDPRVRYKYYPHFTEMKTEAQINALHTQCTYNIVGPPLPPSLSLSHTQIVHTNHPTFHLPPLCRRGTEPWTGVTMTLWPPQGLGKPCWGEGGSVAQAGRQRG